MNSTVHRIALTAGEPSGIGPDIVLSVAEQAWPAEIVVIGDPELLSERARQLGRPIDIRAYDPGAAAEPVRAGQLVVAAESLRVPSQPGTPTIENAPYVIATLERGCDGCLHGEFAALVTAPVNKSVINDAGIPFSGHTEFLAARTGAPLPVMLLVADDLRVALATTHLALREVPDAITTDRLRATLETLDRDLRTRFRLDAPRITVLGLNPHAGESGHLGHEDRDIIEPLLVELAAAGVNVTGPLPADTAFTPAIRTQTDAFLAMYHDQGLPVLKSHGFNRAVNVTLGLPIIRTSVDHGTAFDLAGTGRAETGSLHCALSLAIELAAR